MAEQLAVWQELSRLVVDCDRMDRRYFRELLKESEKLRRVASRAVASWPEGLSLLQDLFSSVFKPCPVLKDRSAVRPSVLLNHAVMARLMGVPEWERLRRSTVLDRGAAVLAAAYLLDFLLKQPVRDPALQGAVDAGRNAERAAQRADSVAYARVRHAEEAVAEAEKWGAIVQQTVERETFTLNNAVYGAVLTARRYVEQALESLDGLGVGEHDRRSLPLDEQLNLMLQALNPNLMRVARLARQYREARRGRLERQVRRPIGEMCTIERGRNLSQLLPSELAMLGHPLGRAEFLRRWCEGQTMQYAFRGRDRTGLPPLILLLDTSRSTEKWMVEGQYRRRDWIASVAVGFLDMAHAEGRDLVTVHFGTVVGANKERTPACVVRQYPAGKASPGDRLLLAGTWVGGGTPLFSAYRQATALIRETPSLRGAEVVCITDGEWDGWTDALREEAVRDRNELGFRLVGVIVGEGREDCLTPLADEILRVAMNDEGFLTLAEMLRR